MLNDETYAASDAQQPQTAAQRLIQQQEAAKGKQEPADEKSYPTTIQSQSSQSVCGDGL